MFINYQRRISLSNFFKGCLGCLGLIVLMGLIIGGCGAFFFDTDTEEETITTDEPGIEEESIVEETTTAPVDQEVENTTASDESGSWETKIKEVAAADLSETEKFDEVSLYAQGYTPSDSEVTEFEQYIVNEYTRGAYLSDAANHEYMLSNIFKSEVVEVHYDDEAQESIDSFAFDFWQNTKYVYRGVDTVDSEPVKANEEQMDKALAKMN